METKHTPGPWNVNQAYLGWKDSGCHSPAPPMLVTDGGEEIITCSEWMEVSTPDLRLIATAPEWLVFGQELAIGAYTLEEVADRARALIAKSAGCDKPTMQANAVLCGILETTMTQIDDEQMRNITSALIEGLNTGGAHHKQWALEQALKMLVPDEFDECKASWQWENGIAV